MSNTPDLDLLDMDIAGIEDLPGFTVPYNGEYNLKMAMALKEVNSKAALECSYEVIDCIRKNNDADPDTVPGTKFSSLFFLAGDPEAVKVSLGRLKELVAGVVDQLGEGNIKILVRDHFATPRPVSATVTRRAYKEKFYPQVKNLKLA